MSAERGAMPPPSASFRISGALFVRAMGLVYLAAFASLAVQVLGLAGSNGILSAAPLLEAARAQMGVERYWLLPTLFWWTGAGDGLLRGACWGGAVAGAAVALGLVPRLGLAVAWVLYLSLATVTRTFLNFQWDALLLEAGFLALFVAPATAWLRLDRAPEPPRWAMFLVRFLLFRLMFSSGVVKLLSGDATWWELRALDVHYFTQPIPTWTAWYAHQLPHAFQAMSTAIMFAIELGAPWLIFGPRRLRLVGLAALAGLQALIAATGNYAYFNMLTLVLCLPLADDALWPFAAWRRTVEAAPAGAAAGAAPGEATGGVTSATPAGAATPPRRAWLRRLWLEESWTARLRRTGAWVTVAILVVVSSAVTTGRWGLRLPWPSPVLALDETLQPFRIVNAYGLFSVMTTTRHEIVIEGSDDGVTWSAYEFRWKPGDLDRAPAFVAPHQPRLDWQMWFAALSEYRRLTWYQNFVVRLLQGSPEVLALLERNPFPDRPPRYIRGSLWDYHFTDIETRRGTGAWWTREPLGLYSPAVSLQR